MNMQKLVSQMVLAPTASPWREQNACGRISPNKTISTVEVMTAISPSDKSSSNTEMVELTSVLENRIEQSR